jgi:hypothetical protein
MEASIPTRIKSWLSPVVCRVIFAVLLAINFYYSWRFLTINCPIDLAGDEAQYWDWSRHLDLAYYSKGPLVAYVIRASCAVLGDTMSAIRLPALILAIGTSICTYWLTRRLFGSDRLALGAVLLGAIVPMYAAGGMLMTIDPPMFFFWALATCLAAAAIFDDRKWAWPLAGLAAGLSALAKYGALAWPPIVLIFLLLDKPSRKHLKTAGPWLMTVISLACLTPVVIWNTRHDWVSLHHVSGQTTGVFTWKHLPEFLGAQIGAVNPLLAVLMFAAAIYTLRARSISDPHRRAMRFLLCVGGVFFVSCLLDSLVAKVQVNWPAPAYFTLLILTAYFIATHCRAVREWFIAAVIFGIAVQPILHDLTLLYPLAAWLDKHHPRKPNADGAPRHWVNSLDMEYKLRGMRDPFARYVANELGKLPAGSFVLCEAYEDASELAFYLPGQPQTYFAGSYWTDLKVRRRWTQFDIWPDRSLDRPELVGKDAIYIGFAGYAPLKQSFEKVDRLPDIVVEVKGLELQRIAVCKCTGFKGMKRPDGAGPR